MPYYLWLIISAAFFSFGEYQSKRFALHQSWKTALLLILAYFLATITWLPAIVQRNQLAITGTVWSILTLLMTIGIGTMVFSESISWVQAIGIGLAIVAVVLLSI